MPEGYDYAMEFSDLETSVNWDCQTCGACCSYSSEWPRFTMESDAFRQSSSPTTRGACVAMANGVRRCQAK